MTLQQMEYIVAVFKLRHFAKAAEYCHVTQPTLSSMVQKLEDELGVKIFDRTSQPIQPTPTGRLVIEQAWRVLVRSRKIKDIVEEEKESIKGTFRIGILPTIAPYLLPRFFLKLTSDYPEMDLRVSEMKTDDIKRALNRGELDMAILVSLDNMEKFIQTPLFYEQFMAYVSEGDRLFEKKAISPLDLTGECLWMLDEGHCFRDQLVRFCNLKAARASQTSYSLGSMETFMRMVEGGKGVTFIPELAVEQLSAEQRRLVRPFMKPIPTRQIVMLTTPTFVRQTLLRLISRAIIDSVPKRMLQLNENEQRL